MGNARLVLIILLLAVSIKPVYAESDSAVSLRMRIRTTSDWTKVQVSGCGDIQLSNYTNNSPYNITYTPEADGFTVWIGKPQFDKTLTQVTLDLVTVNSGDLTVQITKGYIGFTSIKLSAWTGQWYRLVTRIVHKRTLGDQAYNYYTTTIPHELLDRYMINVIPKHTTHPEVLAIYYPWYDQPEDTGVGRHWGNVSTTQLEESQNYPLLGAYSSQNQTVLKYHLDQAMNHGVTCFASSWWGRDTYEDQTFQQLLENCGDFKTCIYYETNRDPCLTPEAIADELNYIINRYGNHAGYLRIREKPVILVFNVAGENRDTGFWDSIRDQTEDCFLVGDFRDPCFLPVFDGVHIYNELISEVHRETTQWISKQNMLLPDTINEFNEETRKGYIICENRLTVGTVSPGYNDTKIRPDGAILPRNGNTTYQGYWENVLAYSVDWVLITSWNEWHEATEIEPSRENGYSALRYTREMIEKWSQR